MRDDCGACEGWKPKLRKGDRCPDCTERFNAYVQANWGLEESIQQRNLNQSLGLCFLCGGGLEPAASWSERLCEDCQNNAESGRVRATPRSTDPNPYTKVWDNHEVDNSGYMVPGFADMAERMYAKARYHKRLADQGGPRGREHAADAASYFRIGDRMKEKANELRRQR